MSVQATAINESGDGQLEFTEVRADTVDTAIIRAGRVAKRLEALGGRAAIGIAYDADKGRRVSLFDGTELDWPEFLDARGIKDEGFKVEPSEIKHGGA